MTAAWAEERSPAIINPADNEPIATQLEGPASCFGDDRWSLHALAGKETAGPLVMDFTTVPAPFQTTMKRIAWGLLNLETPLDRLERATAVRSRVTPGTVHTIFSDIRLFLRWLHARDITTLQDVTDMVMSDYARHVAAAPLSREYKGKRLFSVTRVWLLAPFLPETDRLPQPTWERPDAPDGASINDLLGPAQWSAENKTLPVHPQTMSALLVCAMRFVDTYAEDIIDAAEAKTRLMEEVRERQQPGDRARVDSYLKHLRSQGLPLPGMRATKTDRPDRVVIAKRYLAATLNVGLNSLNRLYEANLPVELGAPLPTPINGRIYGKPWTMSIDCYEVEKLSAMLATACFTITAYLSGMRAEECRALKKGCCTPVVNQESGTTHYRIVGRTFKGALDQDGNTIIGGLEREHPWLVVEPVARAIRIAERLSEGNTVFAQGAFQSTRPRGTQDTALQADTARHVISELIKWWNQHCAESGRQNEVIPPDPDGRVTPRRLRRTLAWFIYRRPGGRIALGVQYGHLRGYTSDGYGSRVSTGLRDVFPMEEAFAVAEHLQHAADRLADGQAVSGPAAKRYLAGIQEFQQRFPGTWLTPRQAAALRRNPQLRVFDNPEQYLTCVYDQSKSLCHPDNSARSHDHQTPALNRCQPGCGNIARTDDHIEALDREIVDLRDESDDRLLPLPLRARLSDRIITLQSMQDAHLKDRTT